VLENGLPRVRGDRPEAAGLTDTTGTHRTLTLQEPLFELE